MFIQRACGCQRVLVHFCGILWTAGGELARILSKTEWTCALIISVSLTDGTYPMCTSESSFVRLESWSCFSSQSHSLCDLNFGT